MHEEANRPYEDEIRDIPEEMTTGGSPFYLSWVTDRFRRVGVVLLPF